MSQTALLIFADLVRPGEITELVESLGGSAHPSEPDQAGLHRGQASVWVVTYPPDDSYEPAAVTKAYTEALGSPPRTKVVLDILRARGSEWLAAEFVLAAAERWHFVIRDFADKLVSIDEFQERFAERPLGFFQDDDFDFAWALRNERADTLNVLLPTAADPASVKALLRSVGAVLDPDQRTDASLSRDGAQIWIYLRESGDAKVIPHKLASYRETLGDPPYNSFALEIFEGRESEMLAVELLETLASKWQVLVEGPEEQLMTIDDLRLRVRSEADDLFSP